MQNFHFLLFESLLEFPRKHKSVSQRLYENDLVVDASLGPQNVGKWKVMRKKRRGSKYKAVNYWTGHSLKKKKKKIISQSFGAGNSINNGCVLVSSVGGKKMRNLCTGFFLNLVRYLSLVRFCPTIVNFGALSCSLNHWWSKTNRPLFLQQKWVYSDSAKNCSSGSIIMVNPVQEEHSSVERKRKLGGL